MMWKLFSKAYEDDEIPQVLPTLDLHGVAKYIESDACDNIFIMVLYSDIMNRPLNIT